MTFRKTDQQRLMMLFDRKGSNGCLTLLLKGGVLWETELYRLYKKPCIVTVMKSRLTYMSRMDDIKLPKAVFWRVEGQ